MGNWNFAPGELESFTVQERYDYKRRGAVPSRLKVKQCSVCLAPHNNRTKTCSDECKKDWLCHQAMANPNRNKWQTTRLAENPAARIASRLSGRLYHALKSQSATKASKSAKLLGCSPSEFMNYLLSHKNNNGEFTAENYGKVWHVDHIRPLASFDLTKESEQYKAFNYTNCQPMKASENISKGSLYNGVRHKH